MVGHHMQPRSVPVKCADCGFTTGTPDQRSQTNKPRCDDCGKFCDETDEYCAKHSIQISELSYTDSCPGCDHLNDIGLTEWNKPFGD